MMLRGGDTHGHEDQDDGTWLLERKPSHQHKTSLNLDSQQNLKNLITQEHIRSLPGIKSVISRGIYRRELQPTSEHAATKQEDETRRIY